MQRTLAKFLRALRASEIPISPAEAIDAHNTLVMVGYSDRTLLKDSLCATLAKSAEEVERFDDCFEMFFTREEFRGDGGDHNASEDYDTIDPALIAENPLAQLLEGGDESELAQAMEQAANEAGVANIRFATQRNLFTRRMLDQMGLRDMERLIARLNRAQTASGTAAAQRLEAAREYLFDQARQYTTRQFDLYARFAGEQLRAEFLVKTSLSAVEQRDFQRMHRIVRRMAHKLATRYNRRRKQSKRGVLDVRRTLRRNMAHDGILFETVWKQTRIEKPKIVVICDVSQSVAAAARFLLLFLYSLNEVIASLRAFAFSSNLIEISDILESRTVEQAIPEILEEIGFRPTDYGQAFADFDEQFLDSVDRRTTIIMLGDVRTNNTDARIDLMRRLHDRAKSFIWLNPEPEPFWGTGDSEMLRYRTFCHVAKTCSTVQDLENIIDDVLKTYFRA
jgi:uncharacterized protein with von Willebrand factor type A (vWA) domain